MYNLRDCIHNWSIDALNSSREKPDIVLQNVILTFLVLKNYKTTDIMVLFVTSVTWNKHYLNEHILTAMLFSMFLDV